MELPLQPAPVSPERDPLPSLAHLKRAIDHGLDHITALVDKTLSRHPAKRRPRKSQRRELARTA